MNCKWRRNTSSPFYYLETILYLCNALIKFLKKEKRYNMKNLVFLILSLSIFMFSCQSDPKITGEEKSVEEVLTSDVIKKGNLEKDAKKEIPPAVPADTVNVGKIKFEEEVYDFGTIDQGESVEHTFKFKNTGVSPLVISNARGSCGCTVPKWPKEPIAVGETGEIQVKFNSAGKKGPQNKSVTLTANTWPVTTKINIKGNVNAPDKPKTNTNTAGKKPDAKTLPAKGK